MWCWMAMRASNETVKCENLLNCRFVRPMLFNLHAWASPRPWIWVIAWDTPQGGFSLPTTI